MRGRAGGAPIARCTSSSSGGGAVQTFEDALRDDQPLLLAAMLRADSSWPRKQSLKPRAFIRAMMQDAQVCVY